ncbi:MAG: hypothetical protein P9L99_09680 [Candidatus Lernaella stagnicola]|nr:hypothetical protein [Candidatus Lernaella stagnicola]
MDILYSTRDVEKICADKRGAKKKLGGPGFKKLRARLADIRAAHNVTELIAGRPHALKGDRVGQFSMNLHGGHRLVFEPAHEPIPEKDDGGIDWNRVTAVCIIFIGDYHD